MVVDNAPSVSQFHKHNIPDNSPYKGKHKQLLMAILAKDKGLMWSAWQGLFKRDDAGKKGEFISDNLDKIAKQLLGGSAVAKDLGSVEAILDKVPSPEDLLSRAEQDKNWTVVQVETIDQVNWFRKTMEIIK